MSLGKWSGCEFSQPIAGGVGVGREPRGAAIISVGMSTHPDPCSCHWQEEGAALCV